MTTKKNSGSFIDTYNPDNLKKLSAAEAAAMENLSIDQLRELRQAYPNKPSQRPYLHLKDNSIKEMKDQLFSLSTWQNLYALRLAGQKKFVVAGVVGVFNKKAAATLKTAKVQDLTEEEVGSMEGLKKGTTPGVANSRQRTGLTRAKTQDARAVEPNPGFPAHEEESGLSTAERQAAREFEDVEKDLGDDVDEETTTKKKKVVKKSAKKKK